MAPKGADGVQGVKVQNTISTVPSPLISPLANASSGNNPTISNKDKNRLITLFLFFIP